jgi:thiol-disulfide isomerase/thioredoxin
MIKKVTKMCGTFCKSLGLPAVVCCVALSIALLYLAKMYLLPLVEGLSPNSDKKKLVYCYMDGCPHCDKAMPAWEDFSSSTTVVDTAKIESKEDPEFMKKMDVQGYPTFLLLDAGGNKLEEYEGDRSSVDLERFAKEKA